MKKMTTVLAVLALVSGCSQPAPAPQRTTPTSGSLKIMTSPSLRPLFEDLATAYYGKYPGVKVSLVAGDPAAGQLADADLVATAEPAVMERLISGGQVKEAAFFATSQLTIVVPARNPYKITGMNNTLKGRRFLVCAPSLKCGSTYAAVEKTWDQAHAQPTGQEASSTAILDKVTSGAVDAGIVFTPEVKAYGGNLSTLWLANADNYLLKLPLGRTAASKQAELAASFIDYSVSDDVKDTLKELGYGQA